MISKDSHIGDIILLLLHFNCFVFVFRYEIIMIKVYDYINKVLFKKYKIFVNNFRI